ncbi:MAG: hypothetical protein BWY52_01452 [Chloroflexi bacterium ADurb.Bin325]|nr:MAG: hypothetical protein BWY52_01452 [Chloroflexi bacterium ADurb.Bin325]
MTHPPLLIESWLPIAAVGAESQRERGASSALPPLYFLHVWWARRPLIASRAAILAGVLPAWSADWPAALRERFPNEGTYHQWFLQLNGISGDPAQARKLLSWARQQGRTIANPYAGARAFTVNPSAEDLALMGDLLEWTWGTRDLSMLDPFAGGGSIPFEALRYGFTTIANDLNPVAAVILKATLDYPARFGPELAADIRKWGQRWYELVKPKLQPYFTPLPPGAEGAAYLWARTVTCPTTGKPVPLSPNWWLRRGDDPVAVRLIAEPDMAEPRFEIVTGAKVKGARPDEGTVTRGVGRSPWTGETIPGDYIKAEAQAGRMGQMLYAIASKKRGGFEFRAPDEEDLEAVRRAETALAEKKPGWIVEDLIPSEPFPGGNDDRPLTYGMPTWADFFSPRQLLAMGTFAETLHSLEDEIRRTMPSQRADAVIAYLAIALNKCPNYSSLLASWHAPRGVMRSVFDRHDFSFKWTYGEFDAAGNLLPWAANQVVDAYRELTELAAPAQLALAIEKPARPVDRLSIVQGSATDLRSVRNEAIHNITVDPPYYDNVQYAELSDFFYVWLKRSVGHLFPEFFRDELTNKDDEAVANPARFAALGSKKRDLARTDYERKMAAAFREMHRVLADDGCLTVMFTHKQVAAWDTLASALIGAGFTVKASWPVHTESEHSLHQAQKNAAASTILLVCRKRTSPPAPLLAGEGSRGEVWWDDLQPRVRETARRKAAEFAAQDIRGVDLYISVFGPTLSIISEQWPVLTSEVDPKTGQPRTLRPEVALDLAREEVVRLRKEGLLRAGPPSSVATGEGPGVGVQFDAVTDWYLMAWDAFAAEQFPYDEARKLAIALGVDLDKTIMAGKRLAAKKGEFIVLQTPAQRRKKGMVDDEVVLFESWIDAAHTALMVYAEDGAGACDVFLRKARLKTDATFRALLQALLNAVPRARVKGKFVRPEAEALENLRLAFFDELVPPAEEEIAAPEYVQMGLEEAQEDDDDADD